MPRQAREKSSSGTYHIMLRGINRQDIFLDREDRERFISTIKKYKQTCGYNIFGYCLMSNHVHLLLREGKETIAQAMKRIGTSYVYWYNMKYERCGHLFQDRFKSEIVEDDGYLLAVLRYIHQNPLKAGMVSELGAYEWSSYNDYTGKKSMVTDTHFILDLFYSDPVKAVGIFKKFMELENQDRCLDDEVKKKALPDEEVKALIKEMIGSENIEALNIMDKKKRDTIIRKLRDNDISIRQLARLTGMGRKIIETAYKDIR
jgi:putative transposase